jgi:hypothetical protein
MKYLPLLLLLLSCETVRPVSEIVNDPAFPQAVNDVAVGFATKDFIMVGTGILALVGTVFAGKKAVERKINASMEAPKP